MIKKILLCLLLIYNIALQAQSVTTTTIAFGSCSHEDDSVQLWKEVLHQKPDVWVWLGDLIYADTDGVNLIKEKYDRQKRHPDYQKLLAKCPVDHDYGVNDGRKDFSIKKESKEKLLDFLDVPADAEVRKHDGIYSSYILGTANKKLKLSCSIPAIFGIYCKNQPRTINGLRPPTKAIC